MLIIEIILTVLAWNRGWRWTAILPVSIAFFIGVMIGLSGGTADLSVIWIDMTAIIVLIFMVAKPKKSENKSIKPPTNTPNDPTV